MKKILFVISQTGFQPHEFNVPKKSLEEAWFKIEISSLKKWICIWWDWISSAIATKAISECKWSDYLWVIFIWWPWAYDDFIWNEDYYRLAREWEKIWAICIAPTIISYSWILNWKKATGWDWDWLRQIEMEKNWVIFTWELVSKDWNIITANWPMAAEEFWEGLVEMFKG